MAAVYKSESGLLFDAIEQLTEEQLKTMEPALGEGKQVRLSCVRRYRLCFRMAKL
jgi:hypothetical protein